MKRVITVGRELGCGGAWLGQHIATRLGLRYIDNEVLRLTADSFAMTEADLQGREEKVDSFWDRLACGFTYGAPELPYLPPEIAIVSDSDLFRRETEIMSRLAAQGDCVIVGRAAAMVLAPQPGMVHIFLRAPLEFRVKRVMENYGAPSPEVAAQWIARSDAEREQFVQHMTGHDWSCSRNYHLSVDSSLLPLEELAEVIIDFVERVLKQRSLGPACT